MWHPDCPRGGEHEPEWDMQFDALIQLPIDINRCAKCGRYVRKTVDGP